MLQDNRPGATTKISLEPYTSRVLFGTEVEEPKIVPTSVGGSSFSEIFSISKKYS